MSPCNHQVLNSTIRSCYFVAVLRHEAAGRREGGDGVARGVETSASNL